MNARLEDKKNLTLLQKSSHATDEAIIAIKEISNQLSPHNLERFGLEKAIKKFISDMHFPSKFEIMLNIEINNVRFDFNIELIIYRIICELVTNTIKHACANHLKIDIFNAYPKLMILYSDNGKGISLPTEQSDGMGISNIRSRVQSVHGNIEIDTKQNKGFSAKITIPIYN
jgi:signal transduction histidine kinase